MRQSGSLSPWREGVVDLTHQPRPPPARPQTAGPECRAHRTAKQKRTLHTSCPPIEKTDGALNTIKYVLSQYLPIVEFPLASDERKVLQSTIDSLLWKIYEGEVDGRRILGMISSDDSSGITNAALGNFAFRRGVPTRLSAAISCEVLQKLPALMPQFKQLLSLLSDTVFRCIYTDWQPGQMFYNLTPHFSQAARAAVHCSRLEERGQTLAKAQRLAERQNAEGAGEKCEAMVRRVLARQPSLLRSVVRGAPLAVLLPAAADAVVAGSAAEIDGMFDGDNEGQHLRTVLQQLLVPDSEQQDARSMLQYRTDTDRERHRVATAADNSTTLHQGSNESRLRAVLQSEPQAVAAYVLNEPSVLSLVGGSVLESRDRVVQVCAEELLRLPFVAPLRLLRSPSHAALEGEPGRDRCGTLPCKNPAPGLPDEDWHHRVRRSNDHAAP